MTWTVADLPDLTGTTALVTGVTGGLGFHTARMLRRQGADLLVTARNGDKARATLERLNSEEAPGKVELVLLDLADLASVRYAAEQVVATQTRLEIVVNNAGVMATPDRTTLDGFELQLGTNHLGHFAWTAGLWPLLRSSGARVVTVSSLMHANVKEVDLDAIRLPRQPKRYRRWQAYGASKLANLQFALELDRRVSRAGLAVTSVAAHPGYAKTDLQTSGPAMGGASLMSFGLDLVTKVIGQPAEAGAWPSLMAATQPGLAGGSYVGPSRLRQTRGAPQLVGMSRAAQDADAAALLWAASEAAIGRSFDVV